VTGRRVLLAEYLIVEDRILLFGVRADWEQPEIAALDISAAELSRFAEMNFGSRDNVRDLISAGMEDTWHAYGQLIEPLARWADADDIICLIPHQHLHYLPLHALKVDGVYLAERNTVVYNLSASVLRHCMAGRAARSSPLRQRTAAVFGDSRGNLPAARHEAVTLAGLLGTAPMLGGQVNRRNLLRGMTGADIVHVAGHAQFSAAEALSSGLELAGDDILTARDIFGMSKLSASLVTLSGCETGISAHHPGDELVGLTRAFLYAKAPSVLVSLWAVADKSACFLMERFYARLLADPGVLKADALRAAMLDTMRRPEWGSFYHWAPFVMIGDWR
jgi:CHAT domain-containing protein